MERIENEPFPGEGGFVVQHEAERCDECHESDEAEQGYFGLVAPLVNDPGEGEDEDDTQTRADGLLEISSLVTLDRQF